MSNLVKLVVLKMAVFMGIHFLSRAIYRKLNHLIA